MIGAGGVFPPPPGYLDAARGVCRDTGVLFVADEVITGFGRCGDWFASSRFGLEPDIVTCAKGITSGYLPMGAVLAAPHVAEPFWADRAPACGGTATRTAGTRPSRRRRSRTSTSSSARTCAAGRWSSRGRSWRRWGRWPITSWWRRSAAASGVLAAVQLRADRVEADPALPAARRRRTAARAGLLVRPLVGGAIAVSPPLVIDDAGPAELAERDSAPASTPAVSSVSGAAESAG